MDFVRCTGSVVSRGINRCNVQLYKCMLHLGVLMDASLRFSSECFIHTYMLCQGVLMNIM